MGLVSYPTTGVRTRRAGSQTVVFETGAMGSIRNLVALAGFDQCPDVCLIRPAFLHTNTSTGLRFECRSRQFEAPSLHGPFGRSRAGFLPLRRIMSLGASGASATRAQALPLMATMPALMEA